jgi:Chloroplast envelope transporter
VATRRRLLRDEFRSGRLEAAGSKAAVLSDLCDRLGYDQDAATEVHKGIYTERIETFLKDSKISGAAGHWSTPQAPQQQSLLLPAASVGHLAAWSCRLGAASPVCLPIQRHRCTPDTSPHPISLR